MVFLPFYLPRSSLVTRKGVGSLAAVAWVLSQALWLQQGFQLEFLGRSTFIPGLWTTSLFFYIVNTWILATIITDLGRRQEAVQ
jgi:phosphatidylinositol glycan class M